MKTSLARKYLPYGFEDRFTPQEIYNAYYQIYVGHFGWEPEFFHALLGSFIDDMAEAAGKPIVRIADGDTGVAARVHRALRRVGAK
jgi:hypothetical protein